MSGLSQGNVGIVGDNPIRAAKDDTLGRAAAARSFAQQVLSLDASEGVVVAVLGAWGFGKTSFVNLARDEFARGDVPILDFNPWMFSGAPQLVDSFFAELSAQLKLRPGLAKIGKDLEEYGEALSGMAWLPLVGPWIERGRVFTKLVSKLLGRRQEGIGERRSRLTKALSNVGKPIVVVVDDIDRLSTSEIRDIFKLVRLTASFPNIIYILAFDRDRVEKALGEDGIPGREYLEKILQVAIDLPAIPTEVLNRQIFSAIDASLSTIENPGSLNHGVWIDVFMEIIRPLIRNMRDVRRYTAAIRGTVAALGGEIALADLLTLEAIRVFLPDVFVRLIGAVDGLTTASEVRALPDHKAQVKSLLDAAAPRGEVVRAMIERLFPAGLRHIGGSHFGPEWKGRWLRERRVAHEDILRLYLERVAGEGLRAFKDAEQAWMRLTDRDALDRYLRSLDTTRLQDVIGSLEVYQDQFRATHVVPGTVVLLNLLPDLPERRRGMYEPEPRLVVARVVYRLLRSLGEPSAVEGAVRQILPELKSLSMKFEVLSIVGHRKGRGHKLVSVPVAAALERAWRDEVRSRSAAELAKEPDLFQVFLSTKSDADPSEPVLRIDEAPEITLALLRSARGEVRSQAMGNRAVGYSPRLAWDALIELYGDNAILRQRIDQLKLAQIADKNELIELAEKYLSGWRPGEFEPDDD